MKMSVVEYFQTTTLGHVKLKLSSLRSCTSTVFSLVQNYIDRGYDVEGMYNQYLLL